MARGVNDLASIAIEFFQRILPIDVFVRPPNHVLIKLNHASRAHAPKKGQKDLLEKGIPNHVDDNSRMPASLPETPLPGV